MGCTSSSNGYTLSEQTHSFLKFRLTRLNARPSPVPQLVIARIGHINSDLESPYSQKKCALYRIDLQERGANGSWENRFSETDSADFILMDPDFSNNLIRVNSSNTVLVPRISDDELHPFELLSSKETSASTRNFLMRAGADTNNLEKYRVREVVFEYNAQLAVFGIVEEDATVVNKISQVLDITAYAHSVINPHKAPQESIPLEVRRKNKWTAADEKFWNQLAPSNAEPHLFFVDDPSYFQVGD
jgi:hypothetical protein